MGAGLQIACALLWNLFSAGIVFGFAAFKPVLVAQGVYSHLCVDPDEPCVEQDLRLNLMFTVAAGVTNIVALVVGYILDHKGPRMCGFIGSFFLSTGALMMAFSNVLSNYFDPYIVGYVSLAIGGPFVFISTFQLANAVPQHSGKVLAALTGAFDTSSALFMFYRIYFQDHGLPSLRTFFLGYLIVPAFVIVCQLFIMPKGSYRTLGAVQKLQVEGLDEEGNLPEGVDPNVFFANEAYRDEVMRRQAQFQETERRRSSSITPNNRQNSEGANQRTRLLSSSNRRVSRVSDTRRRSVLEEVVTERLEVSTQGVYGVLHGVSASDQIRSKWFLYALGLTVLCMLRLNYFMATVRSQEAYLLGSYEEANRIGGIFDVLLPLGGIAAIPFIGLVIDNIPTVQVLKIMCITSVSVGVLGLFHSFALNLLGILLLVVYRPFYYTVVSDYCSKVFGFETFGTVYGLLMSVSGVLNMLQTLIDILTHTVFKMNPTPINLILTTATAVLAALFIHFIQKEIKSRQLEAGELAISD